MITKKNDFELVQEYLNGKSSSMEILVNRHRKRIYTYILLLVKEASLAEDIFQETFIKVINSLHQGRYRDNGRFLSWVMRIAHNLIIDHFRKSKQLHTISNDNYEVDLFNNQNFADKTVEDNMVNSQITSEIKQLVDKLPNDQKEVVILRHYCDLSFKEIAEQTGVSINTALGRMRYAIINLRKLIDEYELNLTMV